MIVTGHDSSKNILSFVTEMANFVVWDYVVFGLMLLVSAGIGVYYRFTGGKQKTTNVSQFFVLKIKGVGKATATGN